MEVTLYFNGIEKTLPIKRITIGLRLDWQLLMAEHSKQTSELGKELSSWQFRVENVSKKLKALEITDENLDEFNRLKALDYALLKENQEWTMKSTNVGVGQVIEIIKFITDTSKLTQEEMVMFKSEMGKNIGHPFWGEQDITKLAQVIEFFRGQIS